MKERIIVPKKRVYITSEASVTGQKEKRGPIGDSFDLSGDDRFGKDSWEKAEAEMQRLALGIAIKKANLTADNIDVVFEGADVKVEKYLPYAPKRPNLSTR